MNDKTCSIAIIALIQQKYCKNEENVGALSFITSSHFPTRGHFQKSCMIRAANTHKLARALRDAW